MSASCCLRLRARMPPTTAPTRAAASKIVIAVIVNDIGCRQGKADDGCGVHSAANCRAAVSDDGCLPAAHKIALRAL